jgi:hypothetical protein
VSRKPLLCVSVTSDAGQFQAGWLDKSQAEKVASVETESAGGWEGPERLSSLMAPIERYGGRRTVKDSSIYVGEGVTACYSRSPIDIIGRACNTRCGLACFWQLGCVLAWSLVNSREALRKRQLADLRACGLAGLRACGLAELLECIMTCIAMSGQAGARRIYT